MAQLALKRLRVSRSGWSELQRIEVQEIPLPSPSDHRTDRDFLPRPAMTGAEAGIQPDSSGERRCDAVRTGHGRVCCSAFAIRYENVYIPRIVQIL